ncbi:hypothetical protein ACFOEK_05285 [Litoribrevibacter euphylliae]|uniref:Uncharacterized protein n=1 Tax=Litoribrevibacter euphylliae TaxID=1834034 RepID=A0ABV7HFF5_9GAMM
MSAAFWNSKDYFIQQKYRRKLAFSQCADMTGAAAARQTIRAMTLWLMVFIGGLFV